MWNRDLQSVRNRSPLLLPPCALPVLHCGSFPWAAVLKDESAPAWALYGLQFLSVNIHLHYGSSWAAVWIVPLHDCRGNCFSSFSSPSLTLVLTGLFLRSFPITLHYHAVLCLFSHTPSLRPPAWLRAQLCLQWVTEDGWNQQCPAWGSPSFSSQREFQYTS